MYASYDHPVAEGTKKNWAFQPVYRSVQQSLKVYAVTDWASCDGHLQELAHQRPVLLDSKLQQFHILVVPTATGWLQIKQQSKGRSSQSNGKERKLAQIVAECHSICMPQM